MVFLSNYLVFKIVLAALGRVDYPVAGDLELKYDTANKIYLSGGSLDYVDDATLYTTIAGETTSYDIQFNSLNLDISNEQILYANDAATNHYFGSDTAISGNYAIVGAMDEDVSGGTDSGAAYIFYNNGTTWSQQAKLKASDPAASDKFGHRVDIEGDYAIVGAYNKNSSRGAAYIFYRSGTSWTQQAKLTASNAGSTDEFGRAVGISGDYAFVGARREDTGGTDRGSVYIYVRSGTTWTQQAQIQASDAQDSDSFGWALSVDGDYAIIGAYTEDTGGLNAGSAYIFYKSGTTWSQQQKIQSSDIEADDIFGVAVSISGDYIVVGASGEDAGGADAGSAYVFVRSGTTWTQQAILRASDAQASDNYAGYDPAVSISGNRVVVGAFGEDAGGSSAGAAYVFQRSGTTWTEVKKIVASDAQASDLFGQTVAIDGTTVLVGAREEDTKATAAGAAYIYGSQKVTNYYITDAGKYSVDATIAGLNYKTNEVDVTSVTIPEKTIQVATGGFVSLALTQDGSVYAWGQDTYGQMGQGTTDTNVNTPVKVKGVGGSGFLSNITKISCGGYHCMALSSDGTVYAWGMNDYGELGDNSITERKTPIKVLYSGDAVSNISAGFIHSALTTTTGKVYCWGGNGNGQVGDNTSGTNRKIPTQVVGVGNSGTLEGIRDVTCGDSFTHAIKDSDGSVYGWGKQLYGMIGNGQNSGDALTPTSVILASDSSVVTGITQISGGGDYALMLKSDGTVYTCGYGSNGQLGDGGTSNNDTGLVQVLGVGGSGNLTNITQIAASESSSLALKNDGTMYSWGNNADGQNGLGTVGGTNPSTPVAITLLTGVDSINAGGKGYMFIASKPDGSVFCWGRGDQGSIGDGTNTADQGTPTQVLAGAGPSVDGKFNLLTEPRLTFDGYNKLSLLHGLSSVSSKLFLGSNVYDIGTLTSDLTIETPGLYRGLVFDTSSNVAYFNKTTVGAIASTMAGYEVEQILYGTHDSDTTSQGGFGHYIDTNGDGTRFVLGLGMDPTTGQYDGRAKVYHLESGTWTLKVDLASPNTASTRFGDSVCMNEDGTRIVVNHYPNNRAYIYDYASGAWPTTPTFTVGPSGTTIIGEGDMDMNKAGTVIVFGSRAYGTQIWSRAGDGTWSETKNWGSGQGGYGVAINGAGTRIVTGKESTGQIFEANYDGSSWGSLTSVIDTSYTSWPAKIRMDSDGTTLIVNADPATEAGIYERQSGTSWTLSQSILSMASYYSRNGLSISYDGNMVLVGDMTNDTDGNNFGRAFLWNKSGGSWSLTKTFSNPKTSPAVNDYWGAGVAIAKNTKDRIIIGMSADSTAGTEYGSVYVHTNAIPDFISFDTYNKLSLSGITNPTSKIHALPTGAESTTTYDIGTATNIYIESAGTYTAEMKGSDGFALDSNVTGTVTQVDVYDYTNTTEQKITASDGASGDRFGIGVTIDGNYAIVSTRNGEDTVSDSGSAYVFKRDETTGVWSEKQEITASDAVTNDFFGVSVSLSGDYAIIGAHAKNSSRGAAYIFKRTGTTWTEQDTFTANDVAASDAFGWTVGISGDYAIIGARGNDGSGSAYIFKRDTNAETWTQHQKLKGNDTVSGDEFGNSVAIEGDYVIIGSHYYDHSGNTNPGAAYIFKRDGISDTWSEDQKLTASDPADYNGFGASVTLSGDYAIIGATNGDTSTVTDSGAVYIFKRNASTGVWGNEQKVTASDAAHANYFGVSVSLSGDNLIVGAYGKDSGKGGAYIFKRDGTTWSEIKNLTASDGATSDQFGVCVAIDSGNAIVGAKIKNSFIGGAYIYTAPNSVPKLDFDTYNKLTFTGADTGSTYKLKYESNTYDLGTISNVYIANPGTYSAEIKGATNFALSSNVATIQTVTQPTLVDTIPITAGDFSGYNYEHEATDTTNTYYEYNMSLNATGSTYFIGYNWTTKKWFDTNPTDANNTFGISATDTAATSRETIENPAVVYVIGTNNSQIVLESQFINPYFLGPSLDFDTYNKLTLSGLESGSTSTLKYGSNTYDIGTASNVYISEQGTYEAESKGTTTFALTKNVVGAMNTPFTAAFHYGAFSSSDYSGAYSTVGAAATAGFVYSDTTPATYTWGTLNSVDTSTSGQTGYSWTPPSDITADVLMVAGGGGGGSRFGGGGGGGGLLHLTNQSLSGQNTVVVGNGGVGGITNVRVIEQSPTNGKNSSFNNNIVYGGGSGGAETYTASNGGSGGGGSYSSNYQTGGTGVSGQGFQGGNGSSSTTRNNGGGGGAGGSGYGGGNVRGDGGIGLQFDISGISTYYGGGGGASDCRADVAGQNSGGFGYGGLGGGGTGGGTQGSGTGTSKSGTGDDGQKHTGGGGGGGAYTYVNSVDIAYPGGDGGSGIVIIRTTAPPSLTHDGYKLVVKNITPTSTTLKYESNTYEIGTATNIYVENTGDYSAEIGGAADFAFTSNTVSGTIKTIEPALRGGFRNGHALTYDGKLYAWGSQSVDIAGALGVGDTSNKTIPTLCTGITQGQVEKFLDFDGLQHRSYMTWIKTTDNKIYATGNGVLNQIPGHTSDLITFTDVTSHFGDQSLSANNIIQVSTGSNACAGLTETGNVWTWGRNSNARGNLGNGGTTSSTQAVPAQITFSGATDNITKLANGSDFTIALDNAGDVWLWGTEWIESTWGSVTPIKMGTALDSITITDISASYSSMYAISNTGVLYASGGNSVGQIMDGSQTDVTSSSNPDWKEITYFSSNLITVNKVYPGTQYESGGFVDTSDGWYAFGKNSKGNLGLGDTSDKLSPVKFTGVSNIKKFAVGYDASHAVTEDGKYYAWGSGTDYARGDNNTGAISYPKYINTLPNILAPSFEFDGYDKVFVGGTFVYEFYLNADSPSDPHMTEISSTDVTLSTSNLTLESGWQPSNGATDTKTHLFDGDLTATKETAFRASRSVGQKLLTLTTNTELTNLSISSPQPKFTPGWKIICNGTTVLTEFENNGTGSSPAPYTKSYSFSSITSLTKYTKGTTTYDAGKASIITVPDPGTYDAQLKKSGVFSLKSATVPATSSTGLYTWAFHHGNFDNAYGDGDILTARDNGRFYADTPAYTGDIGTITAVNPLVSSNVSFRLNEYTQNDSSDTSTTGIMLTEIDVFDDTNTAMTYGTDYRADLYRAAYADNLTDGGSGKLSDETTPYNDDGSRLNDNTLGGSGGYIGWVNGTYNASATGINRKYPYSVDDELIRLVPLTGKIIGKVQFAYKGTGTTPGWKVYRGDNLIETTNYAGTDINTQGNQTTHQIADTVSSTTYTFAPPSGGLTANVLMVAGGGGGAYKSGGAGGAGGLVYTSGKSLSGNTTIVVGNGGEEGINGSTIGYKGKNTSFTDNSTSTIAYGGGGGCSYNTNNTDKDGGSGGGGASGGTSGSFLTGGTGTSGQGNAGGDSQVAQSYREGGGGGGGAGTAGSDAVITVKTGGDGGKGLYYGNVFGLNYGEKGWVAGGGGGAARYGTQAGYGPGTPGLGGLGGGGSALTVGSTARKDNHGMNHTGGGGGGGAFDEGGSYSLEGGAGGSGIVLLQTNVETPNVNSEVKIPEPHCHVLIEKPDDTQFSHLPSLGNNNVHTGGSIVPNIPRADGSVSNVYYASSTGYFTAAQAGSLVSTVEGIFYPIEQERYDNILEIGHNSSHDVELEMASDGTAKLYRDNGGTHLASSTVKCFTVGKWHHIALTLDANRNAVGYVNGYPVVSATYASAILPGSRQQMCLYRTGVRATFRKFLVYYFKTYNSVLNHKQIMQLASSVGLGPKLEYDGLNTIKILNTEPGSSVKLFTSNVADTSNVFIVADPAAGEYTVPEAGKYYAEIKGTDTFTITKTIDADGPLYQYPPVATGTKSSLTTSLSADTWNTWTMSGASTGNGQYQAKTSHATVAPGGTHAAAAGVFTNGVKIEIISDGGASIYSFLQTNQLTNFDITLQLPSAKIIRKYVLYPADTNAPVSTPGGSVDPTLPGNGSEENTRRVKSWVLKGSNDSTSWTTIHTVTNKPPSIYGDVHTVSSPASYQYYQLSISANNGSSQFLSLGEWQLWGDA